MVLTHLKRSRGGRLAAAALVPAALLATGCGAAARHPQVASLPSAGPARSVTTASTAEGVPDPEGRPRQGLDANSQQQLDTLYDPYYNCVYHEHQVAPKGSAAYIPSLRRAVNACIRLDPLPPWPLDPENPQSRAFIGRTVTCMRQKGYDASASLDSGYIINAPEWTVVYVPGSVNASSWILPIQYRCQDRAQRESSG